MFAAEWADGNVGSNSTAMGSITMASGENSTAMGRTTTASANSSTAMGIDTRATGFFSTAMGEGTTASGISSTAMGRLTTASGNSSTAMGNFASTNNWGGSFVYGDNSTSSVVNATAANSFVVRAAGATIFYSNTALSAGVQLSPGDSAWASVSARNKKENFRDEDGEHVLAEIARLPLQSWNYKAQTPGIRHLGPTAQDFYAAFHLGAGRSGDC